MSVIITREDIIAYAEVDYIINHMDEKYIQKVPEVLRNFFAEVKDPEHEINIDPYKPLQSQGLRKYTLEIIALLHLKYWCENEERKKELYELMLQNQNKLEEQLREKLSIDNLFDNNQATIVTEKEDLRDQDYSRPKVIQKYDQYTKTNPDIHDYSDVVEEEKTEEKLPEKVNEKVLSNNFFASFFDKIRKMFKKKKV